MASVSPITMDMSLRYLKGVGERRAAQFARLGVTTAGELLRNIPRSYEDWSKLTAIQDAPFGEPLLRQGDRDSGSGRAAGAQGPDSL